MTPEQRARQHIDQPLRQSGWAGRDPSDEPASVLLAQIKETQGGQKKGQQLSLPGV